MISASHACGLMLVAPMSYQWLLMAMAHHFLISGNVLSLNCPSLLAVTITVPPGTQSNSHCATHARKADFPTPRPDTRASLIIFGGLPCVIRLRFSSICWRILRKARSCHALICLLASGVPFLPHGYLYLTYPSGSSANSFIRSMS